MRTRGAAAALLLRAAAAAASCALLQRDVALSFNDFPLRILDAELNVTVMGAGGAAGGAARAAAALLYVALRYGLGYSTHFELKTPNLCDLTMKSFDWLKAVSIVAPVATIPGGQCERSEYFASMTSQTSILNESLHLMAYLPHNECKIRHVTNGFLNINISLLETCGFQPHKKKSGGEERAVYNILVRRERTVEDFFNKALQKQIEATTKWFNIISFVNDTEFRREIHKLRRQNTSFLFVDEYIWAQDSNVFPVQLCNGPHECGATPLTRVCCSVRIGDGFRMRVHAPPIYNIVRNFKPKATDLFNILENEISTDNNTILEAACTWARQHFVQFKEMIPPNFNNRFRRTTFTIKVYLCEGDQYIDDYKNIIQHLEDFFRQTLSDIRLTIYDTITNCLDVEGLYKDLESLPSDYSTVGSITWGCFLDEQSRVSNGFPLLLIGAADPDVSYNNQTTAVHSANGSLIDLIRAYKHLLQMCKWSRIAILSDTSVFSKKFMNYFLSNEKNIIYREMIVTPSNIDLALKSLYSEDARIFLVNANSNITTNILCAAVKQGMTGASYTWITRGWQVSECDKDNNTVLHHYTLELTSLKDPAFSNLTKGMKHLLMETTDGNEFTPGRIQSLSLADALLQLGYGFNTFIHKYPSHVYSLHNTISIKILSKILKTRRTNTHLFAYPLIIIGKWKGIKGNIAAVWHMKPQEIVDINWNQSSIRTCEQLLGRDPPKDRATCLIQTGDPFTPRCHSVVVFSSIAIIVFIFVILYTIYHDRKSSIQLHKKQYEEYLMSSRQRATSILENYLVERNSVQLLHIIGLGSFGQVRFAKLHRIGSEAVVVAAKEPRGCFAVEDENIFLREACVLAPLCHENVIRLVGVCLEDGPPIVLMEHASYSDLQQYLILRRPYAEGARHGRVTAEQAMEVSDEELTRFGREAAGALEYLATCRLVHRDVRAGNCLVDKNRSLKLADFGMARELDSEEPQYVTQRRALFPVIWMAPESITFGVFSHASDVWSLGVLFLELATLGARPFGEWSVETVVRYLKSGGHPPLPPDTSMYTSRLVLECWQQDPQARPSAGDVRRRLARSPPAISPALLTPHPPESPVMFTRPHMK